MTPPRGKIRVMHLGLRDEDGLTWDRSFGWLRRDDAKVAVKEAARVIVHDEASREARPPATGEVAALVNQVSDGGESGPVYASVYRSGGRTLVMLSIADRG